MSKKRKKREPRRFTAPNGTAWTVEVMLPSHSSAMVTFRHPDDRTARRDRYNWFQANVPKARDVEARLDSVEVLDSITDQQLALLFRRSMLISAADDPDVAPIATLAVQS